MGYAISRNYQYTDFSFPLSEQDKLRIWKDRVGGWFLEVAIDLEKVPHAGFALMLLVTVYFEFIAQCEAGHDGRGREPETFKSGIKSVYGSKLFDQHQLDRLYRELRCGMLHTIFPKASVVISGDYESALEFEGEMLKINPHIMLRDVRDHFKQFCERIDGNDDKELRSNVLRFFDDATSLPKTLSSQK